MRTRVGKLFPAMVWAALASALLAVTMGGVVRVTGSGLGCPDWPLCHGRVIPLPHPGPWLEYLHRLSVASLGIFTVLTVVTGLGRYRLSDRRLVLVLLVPVLLVLQAALGAVTVLRELSPPVALAHTGVAAGFVGLLALVASGVRGPARRDAEALDPREGHRYWWLLVALSAVAFLQVLSGAYVTRTGASLACPGLPLCGAGPSGMGELQWVHMAHRALAVVTAALLLVALGWAWALRHRGLRVASGLLAGVLAAQIGLGITNVALRLPPWSRGAHLALAIFFFAALLWVAGTLWAALRGKQDASLPRRDTGGRLSAVQTTAAYFRLTKPRIMLLLLVSTAAGMFAATGGRVPWTTAAATLLAGALCAGGAKAMNSYLDRDTDRAMSRTRRRPLPQDQVSPRGALAFSVGLSLLSLPLFLWVSPLTAALGAVAWLYYVLLYSVYLKRRTLHNVVIGGAAGAFPPLIGWTAATGRIELAAVFLFLIVFFWTPPHAWALMMLLKEDYRRVNIPMLPVVRGDRDTTRQILAYSSVLAILTLVPVGLGLFGPLYLAVALLLGGGFIAIAAKLYWSQKTRWAWRLYRYSTVYLGLLLVGLVLDRTLLR